MAFNLSTLNQYKEEIGDVSQLILTPVLTDRTSDYVGKVFGVKGQNVLLPIIENDVSSAIQTGGGCTFNPVGDATIKQFSITTVPFKINEQVCPEDLEKYFTGQWLPNTSRPDTFQTVDKWVNIILSNLSLEVGKMEWLSDTSLGAYPVYLKQMDGFLKKIDASVPSGNKHTLAPSSTITNANVISVFDKLIFELLPHRNYGGGRVYAFCGIDVFMILQNAIKNSNYFHYTPSSVGSGYKFEMNYFGTPVTVVGLAGLNSNNVSGQVLLHKQRIVVTYGENLVIGANAENDLNDFDLWYSQDFNQLRLKIRFHLGVSIKFPELITTFYLS